MSEIVIGNGKAGAATLPLRYLNRHVLVTGSTGSGKTTTVMRVIEQLVRAGIPVIAPDVKGDLLALARPAPPSPSSPTAALGCPCGLLWRT